MFVIDLCKTCVHQCKSKIPKSTFKDPIIELLFKTSSQKKMHHYLHRLGAFPMSYNSFLKCHASIYNMFSNYSEIDKANCRYLVAGCGNQNLRSTTCRTIVWNKKLHFMENKNLLYGISLRKGEQRKISQLAFVCEHNPWKKFKACFSVGYV